MSFAVVVALFSLEVRLSVAGKRFDVAGIREHDGSPVVHFHLAVGAVHGFLTIDVDVVHPVADYLAGLDGSEDEHGMFGVGNVHASRCGEGCGARYDVVHVGGQFHGIVHLFHGGLVIGRLCGESQAQE